MKKALLAAAVFTTFIAGAVSVAHADPAMVINPAGLCGLADGNGVFLSTTDTKITATQSNNGNATASCKADVAPSTTGHAVKYDFSSTGGDYVDQAPQGPVLHVTFKGTESEYTIGPEVPVLTNGPGDISLLKPGVAVFVIAVKHEDGKLTSARLYAEKDGIKPPM
jgi:hypothetical protein